MGSIWIGIRILFSDYMVPTCLCDIIFFYKVATTEGNFQRLSGCSWFVPSWLWSIVLIIKGKDIPVTGHGGP
jgi:hypothetical protein